MDDSLLLNSYSGDGQCVRTSWHASTSLCGKCSTFMAQCMVSMAISIICTHWLFMCTLAFKAPCSLFSLSHKQRVFIFVPVKVEGKLFMAHWNKPQTYTASRKPFQSNLFLWTWSVWRMVYSATNSSPAWQQCIDVLPALLSLLLLRGEVIWKGLKTFLETLAQTRKGCQKCKVGHCYTFSDETTPKEKKKIFTSNCTMYLS